MKVILKDNIENLGKKGDIVKVAPGYGRNYLLPKKLALKVTATNMKMIEMVQKSLRKGLEKEMKVYLTLIEKLNAVTLTFHRKSGEKDTIFGSVSVTDIRDALIELSFDVEKKKILLDEPIKRLGNYTVPIKVFHDDRAEIKLEVVREGGPEEAESPERTEAPIATEAEPVAETEAAPVAAETAVEPEAKTPEPEAVTPEPEPVAEIPEPEAGEPEPEPEQAEPEAVTPESEPVAEIPEPEAAAETPEPEVVIPEPAPEAEMPESEKPEEAPAEEPSPDEETPAGNKDTDEKT